MKTIRGRGHPLVFAAVASLLTACTIAGTDSPGFVVRDSAGIRIVENAEPLWEEGAGWTFSTAPSLEIGQVNGSAEYQFNRIVGAVQFSEGRIVVANSGSEEIRFYDPSGHYLQSIGGKGGGPGEFGGLRWIQALPGDSLLAYDFTLQRLSIFDSQGTPSHTQRLLFDKRAVGSRLLGRFADKTLLARAVPLSVTARTNGADRDSLVLFRYSADDSLMNVVVGLLGEEGFDRLEGTGVTYGAPFFARSSEYAIAGNRLFAGDNDTYEIGVYQPDGTLEELIRVADDPRPATQADIDRVRAKRYEIADGIGIPQLQKMYRTMIADEPIPATLPAFGTLLVDAAGNLWVKEYTAPEIDVVGPTRWTVFDAEGRMLGDVSMPGRFEPMQIGDDFVLGVWRDDLDVEYVRMYTLSKAAAPFFRDDGT